MNDTRTSLLTKLAEYKPGEHFKQKQIVNDTGITQQLVSYHFNKFIELGILGKIGHTFFILDTQKLLQTALETRTNEEMSNRRPRNIDKFLDARYVQAIDDIKHLMALKPSGGNTVLTVLIEKIDEMVSDLHQLKRHLRYNRPSLQDSREYFKKVDLDELYESLVTLQSFYSRLEFMEFMIEENGIQK